MMKRRAIRNTLARLGMQAKPGEVVAALALHGIAVSESLVRAVLMEMLREQGGRQPYRIIATKRVHRPQKVPPRR